MSFYFVNLTDLKLSTSFRYKEMTCEWVSKETGKVCRKVLPSLNDMVTHLTIDHVGGPEQTDHACYWQECPR